MHRSKLKKDSIYCEKGYFIGSCAYLLGICRLFKRRNAAGTSLVVSKSESVSSVETELSDTISASSENFEQSETESESSEADEEKAEETDSKILIVYFTPTENTENYAVSGATPIIDGYGTVRVLANMIQSKVVGDLFAIQTDEKYPVEYNAVADVANEQNDNNGRPVLLLALTAS